MTGTCWADTGSLGEDPGGDTSGHLAGAHVEGDRIGEHELDGAGVRGDVVRVNKSAVCGRVTSAQRRTYLVWSTTPGARDWLSSSR